MKKNNIHVFIQARFNSKRLPGKVIYKLGNYPVVVLAALRAGNTGLPVTVLTSTNDDDDVIFHTVKKHGLECFRGDLDNVLSRFVEACELAEPDDIIVRLTADNVLPDGHFIECLINSFNDKNHIDYLSSNHKKSNLPYGMSIEIFNVKALRLANRSAISLEEKEHVTPFIKNNFKLEYFKYVGQRSLGHLRCTLDYFSDYYLLYELFSSIPNPVNVSWEKLAHKLDDLINERKDKGKSENFEIVMGTVQIGLNYGIKNKSGLPSEISALKLLEKAVNNNITSFDTARAYGLSEYRIGLFKNNYVKEIDVVTKLDPLTNLSLETNEDLIRDRVKKSIFKSMYYLKQGTLGTLLLHRWTHYKQWNGVVWDELVSLKNKGFIQKLGVSVTGPEEATSALDEPLINYIQCPINILDWRWNNKLFQNTLLKRKDIKIVARSIYLQGIILMENNWPPFNNLNTKKINYTIDLLKTRFGFKSRAELCLAYIKSIPWLNGVVIGMENEEQLKENLRLINTQALNSEQRLIVQNYFKNIPIWLLNPQEWPSNYEDKASV